MWPRRIMPPRQRPHPLHQDEELVNDGDGDVLPPPPPPPPPPNKPNVAQFWAIATQFIATMMANMPRQIDREEMVDCSSTNYFSHNSALFEGSEGPMATNTWITSFQDLA